MNQTSTSHGKVVCIHPARGDDTDELGQGMGQRADSGEPNPGWAEYELNYFGPVRHYWLSLTLSLYEVETAALRLGCGTRSGGQIEISHRKVRSTGQVGPPTCTVDRTVFELWLGGL